MVWVIGDHPLVVLGALAVTPSIISLSHMAEARLADKEELVERYDKVWKKILPQSLMDKLLARRVRFHLVLIGIVYSLLVVNKLRSEALLEEFYDKKKTK